MIVNAKVAKLYQYLHDDAFRQVMRGVEGALDEGLGHFELEVERLEENMSLDLFEALVTMEYEVDYDKEQQIMYVAIED